jgi:hypothetical protein
MPGITVAVGWDNPMTTFFAQVRRTQDDADEDDEDDPIILWLGGEPNQVARAEDLIGPLASYADLTEAHVALLRGDRAAAEGSEPTALQRMGLKIARGRR